MAEVDGVVKKWGNSFGVILPKEVMDNAGLHENSQVHLIVLPKKNVLKKTFGSLSKKLKITGQEAKDLARAELYD